MGEAKVYCKDCRHYGWFIKKNQIDFQYMCWFKKRRNYYGTRMGEYCKPKNEDLNCIDYKRKWWKLI